MSDELVDLIANAPCIVVMEKGWHLYCTGHDKKHPACVAEALRANSVTVLFALGLNPVAMADTDCGWTVSAAVEEAGAWSTAPDGGWATRS